MLAHDETLDCRQFDWFCSRCDVACHRWLSGGMWGLTPPYAGTTNWHRPSPESRFAPPKRPPRFSSPTAHQDLATIKPKTPVNSPRYHPFARPPEDLLRGKIENWWVFIPASRQPCRLQQLSGGIVGFRNPRLDCGRLRGILQFD